jgi:primosomal protein N' (replication factor Y) (superfamily II helicase)
MKIIVDVLFPIFQEFPFSYLAEYNQDSLIGRRAIAPISSQLKSGIIIAERIPENIESTESLKEIYQLIDNKAFINPETIEIIHFISQFYVSSLGEVLKFVIPNGTLPRIKKTYELIDKNIFNDIKKVVGKSDVKYQILMILKDSKQLTLNQLEDLIGKTVSSQINDLIKQQIIKQDFKISKPIIDKKFETYLLPVKDKDAIIPKIRSNAYNQLEVIDFLSTETTNTPLNEIVRNNFLSSSAIKTLIKKDLIKSIDVEVDRQTEINYQIKPEDHELNEEQLTVYKDIVNNLNIFQTHLLFGITGSG